MNVFYELEVNLADHSSSIERIEQELVTLPVNTQVQVLQHLLASATQRLKARELAARQHESEPTATRKHLVQHESDAITYQIIGCAMEVHRRLGCGLREVTYQRALEVQFKQSHLAYRPQQQIAVYDDNKDRQLLGYYIPDFVVEDSVVVEIKAFNGLGNTHIAQVIGYLAVTQCPVGLLVNFGERSLDWRRIFPPTDIQAHRVNTQWLWNPFKQE